MSEEFHSRLVPGIDGVKTAGPGYPRPVEYSELLDTVRRRRSPVPPERAVPAVLAALGDHLPAGEAGYLAVHLPEELRAHIRRRDLDAAAPVPTKPAGFAHEVGTRCGCDDACAGEVVQSVLAALDEAVPHGVMFKVRASVGRLTVSGRPQNG